MNGLADVDGFNLHSRLRIARLPTTANKTLNVTQKNFALRAGLPIGFLIAKKGYFSILTIVEGNIRCN